MTDALPSWGGWGSAVRDDPFGHFAEARCPVQKVRLADGHPAWLVAGYGAAGKRRSTRDPARFPAAGVLDIGRGDGPDFGFGHGIRYCLGAPLARFEARVAAWSCAASSHSPSSSGHAGMNHRPIHQTKETPMTITDRPVDNGVNVAALLAAREALSAAPEAAEFTWRASCTWRNGTHSHSAVHGFTGLGAEQQHRTTYEYDVDHPECFASEDNGATPVEYILVGLAGCLTAGVAAVAQHRGIQLRSVTATIDGEMNILGILGADPDIRNGLEAVTIRFAIDADASRGELEALIAQSQKRSAVFDIVTNPTKVLVELA